MIDSDVIQQILDPSVLEVPSPADPPEIGVGEYKDVSSETQDFIDPAQEMNPSPLEWTQS